eukprot:11161888-Lingulodinium_polyedra.AAC.1
MRLWAGVAENLAERRTLRTVACKLWTACPDLGFAPGPRGHCLRWGCSGSATNRWGKSPPARFARWGAREP